ncbi:MAG: hypothetical protein M3430_20840 [Acidobacteriota bacterium]|nr:hypothetical protein [Acidobacteriota bacterium]
MRVARLLIILIALIIAFALGSAFIGQIGQARNQSGRDFKPDIRRALAARSKQSLARDREAASARRADDKTFSAWQGSKNSRAAGMRKRPARAASYQRLLENQKRDVESLPAASSSISGKDATSPPMAISSGIRPGTSLSRVLHTSQLDIDFADGINLQLADQTGDLIADERTTFDDTGGSFDIAVGRSGARYEVFTAIDKRGTPAATDDVPYGVVAVALDTNGDFKRDTISVYDLERDFGLPSAISVVAGTSRAGREFVIVSSSGYYNSGDKDDPNNEPTAGVVLLVRDSVTGGFDDARSRELVRVGDNRLQNANALALLPNNDLLIADFDSNELRVVRDTDGDDIPDTLDGTPYYRYQLFDNVPLDAPLDIAVNSRGVVFSHSYGNDSVLLAVYDDNNDGRGDADEVVVEGLSLDNNLFFHGLTVDRVGTVYIIQDASGAADTKEDGGNGGAARIDAFPDPALNGLLRDGALYFVADNEATDALSGLSFGVDVVFGAVGHLSMVNSASLTGSATRAGLATILGANLTRGASGTTAAEAVARDVRVSVEGLDAPVLSFNDSQINVFIPPGVTVGANSIVVTVNRTITSADDVIIAVANPGIFTKPQTGTGEAIALLASGMRYTDGPFPAKLDGQASVISLLGTGWRNSTPVSVTIGGRAVTVQYAGEAGGFNGLDQINFVIPDGVSGTVPVVVKTTDGSTSRGDVVITVK